MTTPTPVNPHYAARLRHGPVCLILPGDRNPAEVCLPAPGAFASYAALYREHGYAPIPIRPGSKRPYLSEWSKWCRELPSPELVQHWISRYPKAGLGIALGPASGVIALDLDYDVDGLHARVLDAAGPSPVAKRGQKGVTYFYCYAGERTRAFARAGHSVAELRSTGALVVIPPSIHPDTGRPYEWVTPETLLDRDPASLPTLDAARIGAIFERPRRPRPRREDFTDRPASAAILAEALHYISPDCDYHTWIKVGTALKAALGEAGFDLWDSWSSAGANYDARQMEAKWQSFDPERVSPATVLYLARQRGWRHQR
jgi:hypothetical protein